MDINFVSAIGLWKHVFHHNTYKLFIMYVRLHDATPTSTYAIANNYFTGMYFSFFSKNDGAYR
jgi:hypothetical protein